MNKPNTERKSQEETRSTTSSNLPESLFSEEQSTLFSSEEKSEQISFSEHLHDLHKIRTIAKRGVATLRKEMTDEFQSLSSSNFVSFVDTNDTNALRKQLLGVKTAYDEYRHQRDEEQQVLEKQTQVLEKRNKGLQQRLNQRASLKKIIEQKEIQKKRKQKQIEAKQLEKLVSIKSYSVVKVTKC